MVLIDFGRVIQNQLLKRQKMILIFVFMSNFIPITYNPVWANIYILIGVLCTIIFLIGGYTLNDFLIYSYTLIGLFPILIGFKMKMNNYAEVSSSEIKVYGLLGQLRKQYQLKPEETFQLKNNKIYIKRLNKMYKIKMNSWFINPYDWEQVLDLFNSNEFDKITKHLIDD